MIMRNAKFMSFICFSVLGLGPYVAYAYESSADLVLEPTINDGVFWTFE